MMPRSWPVFLKANALLFSGRLHFSRSRIGEVVTLEDGRTYTIFRQVKVDPGQGEPDRPGAVFQVQFHPLGLAAWANRLFSLLPMPFCTGYPGFRSKLWMVNKKTGECASIYEWNTTEEAEIYSGSFAMRFSKGRSRLGSFKFVIFKK
jgi:hypothetical protein